MGWLDRIRSRGPGGKKADEPEDKASPAVARSSPGLAALFQSLDAEAEHSILDLGHASSRQLEILGRYGRWIRFAGLVPKPPQGEALRETLAAIPANDDPYDIVLGWDVLDRLGPEDRAALIQRLDELTGPGARLYVTVDASGSATLQPTRSTLLGQDRVEQEPVGPPEPAKPQLLPAQAEKLFLPFAVTHAFFLRVGQREYVAVKK